MKNCLVTKLKGSVDNNNLPYLGMGVMDVKLSADQGITIVYDGRPRELKVLGTGEYLKESDTPGAVWKNTLITTDLSSTYDRIHFHITLKAGEYKVLFDKYHILFSGTFNGELSTDGDYIKVNTSEAEYCYQYGTSIKQYENSPMNLHNCLVGDISYYDLSKTTAFRSSYSNNDSMQGSLKGSISAFSGNASITAIMIENNQGINGDISSIGTCTALTTLRLRNTNVSGSVEAFVHA